MQYILRNTHENYTAINNAFTQDKLLEPATIGILTVILTNKPDWVVYPEEIAKRLGVSRRTINRHFQKLEEAGYMRTVKYSFGGNKGARTFRFFSDVPITDSYFDYLKDNLEKELSTSEE
nr:MAG TPA: Dna polymerase B [Caudoviricetes sp.]